MIGTRALSALWSRSQKAGTKLVLVGDYAQVPEIEAGGAFRALATSLEAPELSANRRQAEAWEREALAELRSGEPARAVEAYLGHSRVVLAGGALEARTSMVTDWWRAKATGEDAVMFALTRADVDGLNRLAHALARDAGRLAGAELEVGSRSFAVGDDVITLRPDRQLGVINGTRGKISALDIERRSLTVSTEKGDQLVLPSTYLEEGPLGWGYALTLHKGQGSTVGRAFVLGGEGLYREAGYTGLSRGRTSNDLYLVNGAAFDDESHLSPGSARDPVSELVSALTRSRAHQLAQDAGRAAGRIHNGPGVPGGAAPGRAVPRRDQPILAVPGYLVAEIGPRPEGGRERQRWERAARAVEAYRSRYGVDDQGSALGPEPDDDRWRCAEHRAAARLVERARAEYAHERSIVDDMGR